MAVAFDRRATPTIGELPPRWPPAGQDSPPSISTAPVVVATAVKTCALTSANVRVADPINRRGINRASPTNRAENRVV